MMRTLTCLILLAGIVFASNKAMPITETPGISPGIVVGRVTDHDACISVMATAELSEPCLVTVWYGLDSENQFRSDTYILATPLACVFIQLNDLLPNQVYEYVVEYADSDLQWQVFSRGKFATQKTTGSFDFVTVSDIHLGQMPSAYYGGAKWQTGKEGVSILSKFNPDFTVDLGDSPFSTASSIAHATDKYRNYREYVHQLSSNGGLYLALGNHEGEAGFYQRGTSVHSPLWNGLNPTEYRQLYATAARLACLPNPTCSTYPEGGEGSPGYDSLDDWFGTPGPWNAGAALTDLQNFYAWTWGDALFIVLDPLRYTLPDSVDYPDEPADYTLGETQLRWLEDVLANSTAKWKFLFAHHLVGGAPIGRDGNLIDPDAVKYSYSRGSGIEAVRQESEQAYIHS
jgi:phosphodiesterase/alkaline phosphatase D-like protein